MHNLPLKIALSPKCKKLAKKSVICIDCLWRVKSHSCAWIVGVFAFALLLPERASFTRSKLPLSFQGGKMILSIC